MCTLAEFDINICGIPRRYESRVLSKSNEVLSARALTIVSKLHAVYSKTRVVLPNLPRLNGSQRLDRRQAGVLGESHGNGIEGVRESPHGILLQAWSLVGSIRNREGAGNFCSTTSIYDTVVLYKIADDAEGIMEGTLGLVDDLENY